jgi:hypothetical protein
MKCNPEGKRRMARPEERWIDVLDNDLRMAGV